MDRGRCTRLPRRAERNRHSAWTISAGRHQFPAQGKPTHRRDPILRCGPLGALLASLALFSARAYGQGSVTTSDGMTLTLASSGSVSALKVGATNYASGLASGFFLREASTSMPDLVPNGSFESGSGTPTSWSILGGTGGTWSIDTTTVSAGARSMKLSIPGTTGVRSPDLASNSFALVPNMPYTLTCSFKTSGGGGSGVSIYIIETDQVGNAVQRGVAYPWATNAWGQKIVVFTSSPITSHAYIKINVSGGYGTAWVDDVRLTDPFGGS